MREDTVRSRYLEPAIPRGSGNHVIKHTSILETNWKHRSVSCDPRETCCVSKRIKRTQIPSISRCSVTSVKTYIEGDTLKDLCIVFIVCNLDQHRQPSLAGCCTCREFEESIDRIYLPVI